MNAHNEQHDPASAVVKQNLTTQPAAAQEAVGWQWRWLDTDNTWSEWVDGGSRKEIDARIARWKADGEDHRMQVRPLFAAPAPAAQEAVAYRLEVQTVGSEPFTQYVTDRAFIATLRNAGCKVSVTPLYAAPVTAAPGIDLRNAILQLQEDALHMKDPGDTVNAYNRVLDLIDASPNGALNEQLGSAEGFKAHISEFIKLGRRHVTALYNSPRDEISMTDTGCWIQYAMQLLQLDSPKGGSEARDALRVAYRHLDVDSLRVSHRNDLTIIECAMHPQAGDAEVQP